MLQSTLFLVILITMFLRFIFFVILVYNTTLRYENVNKNIPRLFVCVSVTLFKSAGFFFRSQVTGHRSEDISMQQNNVSLYNFDGKCYRDGICTKWVEI